MLRIVQIEIDGVGGHIGVQPGEMVAHLATDHGQAGQYLEKCPSAARGRHHARVLVEHGRVVALAAPVRRIHPVDGVIEIHERLALQGVKELGTVGGEPIVGGLSGQGVIRSSVLQLRVDQHLVDPGAA